MIIIFTTHDSLGRRYRLSAVCGPTTTGAGAVNLLRNRLSIPNDVSVELHLDNEVPIRHLTTPLTSLRKQRSGTAHALQLQLSVTLTGAAAALKDVNYGTAEVVESPLSEAKKGKGSSATLSTETATATGVAAALPADATHRQNGTEGSETARVRKTLPTERPPPVTVQARIPASVRAKSSVTETASLGTSAGAAAPESAARAKPQTTAPVMIKRPPGMGVVMPLSARPGPTRSTFGDPASTMVVPQTARASAKVQRASNLVGEGHVDGVQTHKIDGVYKTGYARRDTALTHIMLREYPKVVQDEPATIVMTVKNDERLCTQSHNTHFSTVSNVPGVDDATYSRCLSIGLAHGQEVRGGAAAVGRRLALYGELSTLRHSCFPNAVVQYDLFSEPFSGSCRCAAIDGIHRGEEITYLYRCADSLAFLLLSRERRQNILRRTYFFECDCSRCNDVNRKKEKDTIGDGATKTKSLVGNRSKDQVDAEATLTGVFFTDSSVDRDPVKQTALSETMHADFDALQLMEDTGVEITLSIPGNVPPITRTKQCNRLLAFLRKYGSSESVLRLHENHWRLNLVRAAYVQETVRLCAVKGATPEARSRDPQNKKLFTPTKAVYDVCLKQLAVEALFIPAGHPHGLTTYESFLYLVAILPPHLAESVMRNAENASKVRWQQLRLSKEAWGVLKRSSAPYQAQRLLEAGKQPLSESNPLKHSGVAAY